MKSCSEIPRMKHDELMVFSSCDRIECGTGPVHFAASPSASELVRHIDSVALAVATLPLKLGSMDSLPLTAFAFMSFSRIEDHMWEWVVVFIL